MGVGREESGGIVRRLQFQRFGIVLESFGEIAAGESRFSGAHRLFDSRVVGELDCSACRQLPQELHEIHGQRTGIAQLPGFVQDVARAKTLLSSRLLILQCRRVFDQRRRQRDQHFIIFGIGFYKLFEERQSFQALAAVKQIRRVLSLGLVSGIRGRLRNEAGRRAKIQEQ